MKILVALPESHLTRGSGIATYTRHASKALTDAGHHVHLVTFADPKQHSPAPGPLQVTYVTEADIQNERREPNPNPFAATSFAVSRAVEKLIAQEHFDIIEGADYLGLLAPLIHRKRAGLIPHCPPIAVVNHSLSEDMSHASARLPNEAQLRLFAMEANSCRYADLLFAPSQQAAHRLRRLPGVPPSARIELLRLPYESTHTAPQSQRVSGTFVHLARLSTTKGIDYLARFLNALQPLDLVQNVNLIGEDTMMAFSERSGLEHFLRKLHPKLHDAVKFQNRLPYHDALALAATAQFHPNFSLFETYCYATIETIHAGVAPIVNAGSPMAEFVPETLCEALVTDTDWLRGDLAKHVAFWNGTDAAERIQELQAHAQALVSPRRYADEYERIISRTSNTTNAIISVPSSTQDNAKPPIPTDVTVLISCYNDTGTLTDAVASARNQTVPPQEILILNDGSNEASCDETFAALAAQANVRVLHQTNRGICASRRRLVEEAHTHWVIILDSDDTLEPTYIEATLVTAALHPQASAVIPSRRKTGDIAEFQTDFLFGLPQHWVINDFGPYALAKRDAMLRVGWDTTLINGEADDWVFWLRFGLAGHRAEFLPLPLYNYIVRRGSVSWPWSEGHTARTSQALQRLAREFAQSSPEQCAHGMTMLLEWTSAQAWHTRGGDKTSNTLHKAMSENVWVRLGLAIGLCTSLQDTLDAWQPLRSDLESHLRNSRWIKIGRAIGLTRGMDVHLRRKS